MPSGGRRAGAGRKPKLANPSANPLAPVADAGTTPLEYVLQLMRDESADHKRRDWAAATAAMYVHARATEATRLPPRQRARVAAAAAENAAREAVDQQQNVLRAAFAAAKRR